MSKQWFVLSFLIQSGEVLEYHRTKHRFMTRAACQEFVDRNDLVFTAPENSYSAALTLCDEDCFCQVYRKQIIEAMKRGKGRRAFNRIIQGYTRMLRNNDGSHIDALTDFAISFWRSHDEA